MTDSFCAQCGQAITGKFCSNCGKPATAAGDAPGRPADPVVSLIPTTPSGTTSAPRSTAGTISTPLGTTNPMRLVVIVALVLGALFIGSMVYNAVSTSNANDRVNDAYCESFGSDDPSC